MSSGEEYHQRNIGGISLVDKPNLRIYNKRHQEMGFQRHSVQFFIAVVLLVIYNFIPVLGQTCIPSSYHKFASKTAYRFLNVSTPDKVTFPACTPVQMYVVARHGTRFPGASDMTDMIYKLPHFHKVILESAEAGRGGLCPDTLEFLKRWKLNVNGSSTNLLAPEGREELITIAKNLKIQFPTLLGEPYSNARYRFLSTDVPRALDSAKAFAEGLFSTDKGVQYDVVKDNELLRSYKSCNRWEKEVDDNETAHIEFSNFIRGLEMHDVAQSVASRAGINETLTYANISILYEMCRFESAWNRRPSAHISPWCHLFDNVDLQVMEYSEDVKNYWKNGYGHSLNYEIACPLLKNLVDTFGATMSSSNETKDSERRPLGLFHFTHSGMILKFYARLGLFRDHSPLLASNYATQGQRKWKTSEIDPFAGNVVFVLFNCSTAREADYRIGTYVQQREVILPNCTSFMCPFKTFQATYGDSVDNCDLMDICRGNNSSSALVVSTVVLAAVVAGLSIRFSMW